MSIAGSTPGQGSALILLGRSWPVAEWLIPDHGPTRATRWAFIWQVALADIDALDKLEAAEMFRDRWGPRELRRALRLAAATPGRGLDRTMAELARRLDPGVTAA